RPRTGRSCGGGRTGGGSGSVQGPWSLLLATGCCFFSGRPAVTIAITEAAAVAIPIAITEAAAIAVAETAAAAIVALAIPIDLAHHHRGAFLVLLDTHGEVAQHIFIEPLLPLDLVDHGRRGVEVHEGVVRLAVLAQPIGQRLDAPLFELGDLAAHLLDDALEVGGQLLDLLRARVLAREED